MPEIVKEELKYKNEYVLVDTKNKELLLFHGTPESRTNRILKEGLCGGFNTVGGNRGTWDVPTLFLAQSPAVAKKYGSGNVLTIRIPFEELSKFEFWRVIDQLGDASYVFESEDNEPIISSKYISKYNESRDYDAKNIMYLKQYKET